jgi:nickel/cobalt exporter
MEGVLMDEKDKLPIIIKHWIEHNESHIEEYRQWAEKAGEMGMDGIKTWITEAIKAMEQSDSILKEALKDLEAR